MIEENRGNLINVSKYMNRRCQEDKIRSFSLVPSNRTRGIKSRKWCTGSSSKMQKEHVYCAVGHGTDCPERLWSFSHWKHSRTVWTQFCTTCSTELCLSRMVELDNLQWSLPTLTILWFYYSCSSISTHFMFQTLINTACIQMTTFGGQ